METVDPFGWHKVDGRQIHEIRAKLGNFESMTWGEIFGRNNHPIPITDICKQARERLQAIGLDDLDELVSIRLSGTERIWGMLEYNVMVVLWWDPDHQIYPYEKKHT